jgi:hypothetical protein
MKPRVLILSALVIALGPPWSGASAQSAASRAVPPTIPTVSLNNVARQGFFYAGGKYVLTDFPARGRSQYVPGVDGVPGRPNLNIRTAPNLEEIFTAAAVKGNFPQAKKHTAWPGTGRMGDKAFDDFARTQVQFLAGPALETMTRDAYIQIANHLELS